VNNKMEELQEENKRLMGALREIVASFDSRLIVNQRIRTIKNKPYKVRYFEVLKIAKKSIRNTGPGYGRGALPEIDI
jgi:hypothetical protein